MLLPIYTYGTPVLKQVAEDIDASYPNLNQLIANMFDTMSNADGVGLAAPQIGLPIRLFVIDLSMMEENYPEYKDLKMTFINAHIIERSEEEETIEEGCLSVPGVNENVTRPKRIKIQYVTPDFQPVEREFDGFLARVIQHEYDHLDGILFVDKISGIRKQLIKSKITNIINGKLRCSYKVKTAAKK